MAKKIFISYRRDDSRMTAGRLHDALARHFGKKRLFMDVDNLLAGQRFDRELDTALNQCDVLLLVVGPHWMDILEQRVAAAATDPDERDYVRDEIAAALARNITVIPVLVDGAKLPSKSALPDDIQDLALHQKHDISYERFGRDVDDLASAIRAVSKRTKDTGSFPLGTAIAGVFIVGVIGAGGYAAFDSNFAQWIAIPMNGSAGPTKARREAEASKRVKTAEAQRLTRLKEREDANKKSQTDPALSIKPGSGKSFKDCGTCPEMVVVPAGRFMMGSPVGEEGRSDDEGPQREVTIDKPFSVGKYEVTWNEWEACVTEGSCDNGPVTKAGGDIGWGKERRPVIQVNWIDAKAYTSWLSEKTRQRYRMLTEAEWEYAARATSTNRYTWGNSIGNNNANCPGCNAKSDSNMTTIVGTFAANKWGLHDMLGNVWEWVADCYLNNYNNAYLDGRARTTGQCDERVLRGGSWRHGSNFLRPAHRARMLPVFRDSSIGFRVARTITP